MAVHFLFFIPRDNLAAAGEEVAESVVVLLKSMVFGVRFIKYIYMWECNNGSLFLTCSFNSRAKKWNTLYVLRQQRQSQRTNPDSLSSSHLSISHKPH